MTPLIKEKQRVKRKLPGRLKKRRTVEVHPHGRGHQVADHRQMQGGRQREEDEKRKICVIAKPKTNPTLVLSKAEAHAQGPDHQKAKGSATLLRFERSKKYIRKAKK